MKLTTAIFVCPICETNKKTTFRKPTYFRPSSVGIVCATCEAGFLATFSTVKQDENNYSVTQYLDVVTPKTSEYLEKLDSKRVCP